MQDTGMEPRLVNLAIIVGLILTCVGFLVLIGLLGTHSQIAVSSARLIMCVGLGLVLGALGTRAEGKWRGVSMTGGGVVAVALFAIQTYFTEPGFTKTGRIGVDFSKVAILSIIDDHPLYEYRDLSTHSFQFIVLKDKFMNHCIRVQIDTKERGPGKEYFELKGNGDEIAKKYILNDLEAAILWDLDYPKRKIMDGNYGNVVFEELAIQDEGAFIECTRAASAHMSSSLFESVAFAQPIQSNDKVVDTATLIKNLTMDDPTSRRDARDALAAIGPTAITPILNAWHRTPGDYRLKIGAVVVLNNMLRNNPDMMSEILRKLNDDDIRLLVDAVSDNDNTVSGQATELLYSLKDKRIVSASLSAVQRNTSENVVYNNVLILKWIVPDLDSLERKRVKDDVLKYVPVSYIRTRALAETIDP